MKLLEILPQYLEGKPIHQLGIPIVYGLDRDFECTEEEKETKEAFTWCVLSGKRYQQQYHIGFRYPDFLTDNWEVWTEKT